MVFNRINHSLSFACAVKKSPAISFQNFRAFFTHNRHNFCPWILRHMITFFHHYPRLLLRSLDSASFTISRFILQSGQSNTVFPASKLFLQLSQLCNSFFKPGIPKQFTAPKAITFSQISHHAPEVFIMLVTPPVKIWFLVIKSLPSHNCTIWRAGVFWAIVHVVSYFF